MGGARGRREQLLRNGRKRDGDAGGGPRPSHPLPPSPPLRHLDSVYPPGAHVISSPVSLDTLSHVSFKELFFRSGTSRRTNRSNVWPAVRPVTPSVNRHLNRL